MNPAAHKYVKDVIKQISIEVVEQNQNDENYQVLQEILHALKLLRDQDNKLFKI